MAHSKPKPEIATASPHKHRHRHSPTTFLQAATAAATATTTSISMQPSNHRQAIQTPASLMYLSIVVCVILNLTSSLGLQLVRAATGTNPALLSSQVSSQAAQQMASLQQQSNSVIQYPATTASSGTSTTTTLKARYKTMYACEDRQLTMDCDVGSKINLIRANFGRFSITQCNDQGQLDLQTDCMSPITFRIMQERCQDKQRCSVNATSLIFGDKCPKTRKYLEVHFQCQIIDTGPDVVHLNRPQNVPSNPPQITPPMFGEGSGQLKPPNNPGPKTKNTLLPAEPSHMQPNYPGELVSSPPPSDAPQPQSQLPTPVINSRLMSYVNAINPLSSDQDNREPIMISMRHLNSENLSRPRCYQWDSMLSQWTEQGTRIIETNQTHTICAFNQATTYVLVMDYSGPMQTIPPPSPDDNRPIISTGPPKSPIFPPLMDNGQTVESYPHDPLPFEPLQPIYPPVPSTQPQPMSTKLVSIFGYLSLAIISLVMGLMALAFVASSMRSSAGAAFKSLGNFAPFSGPKYNKRRQGHRGSEGLQSNKDLLVINNSNGHQFIYAPASTKISNSSSTHILSPGQPTGPAGQHQGTLHRIQQQQMYSGNGATLSSLSGTGAQSNNYYYGLMGLNPLFQQQQSHHFSQHHLNQPQQQQPQHQAQIGANYNHQANKSTISAESANSSSSSSGVESSSTSMQQQQQAHSQQACLVSTSSNQNDFNLMGHHMSSNYGQHQQQQQNLFAQQQQQQQASALTLNAHYSTSGGMQSINMSPAMHNRQQSSQLRDHIYECVDDDKTYMARLLMPPNNEQQQQQFGTLGHQHFANQPNGSRAMTLSSRLLQDVFHQQQQLQQNQNCSSASVARRNFPQTAIVRDHQGAKTNIICSKLAQVKPQRATEIGAKSSPQQFAQTDVMAIYNKDDATTMTTAHQQQQQPTSTNNSCYGQRLDTNVALNSQGKLSTDC